MSTVIEICAALPGLTTEELHSVEALLHDQYRARGVATVYDDKYGVWTEEDQASAAAEVFAMMDQEENRTQPS